MRHSCMCLQCGRAFEMAFEPTDNIQGKDCPICGGSNIVKHDPKSFFEMFFAGAGGT